MVWLTACGLWEPTGGQATAAPFPPMDTLVSVSGAGCMCGAWPGPQALLHLTPWPSSTYAQLLLQGPSIEGPSQVGDWGI